MHDGDGGRSPLSPGSDHDGVVYDWSVADEVPVAVGSPSSDDVVDYAAAWAADSEAVPSVVVPAEALVALAPATRPAAPGIVAVPAGAAGRPEPARQRRVWEARCLELSALLQGVRASFDACAALLRPTVAAPALAGEASAGC